MKTTATNNTAQQEIHFDRRTLLRGGLAAGGALLSASFAGLGYYGWRERGRHEEEARWEDSRVSEGKLTVQVAQRLEQQLKSAGFTVDGPEDSRLSDISKRVLQSYPNRVLLILEVPELAGLQEGKPGWQSIGKLKAALPSLNLTQTLVRDNGNGPALYYLPDGLKGHALSVIRSDMRREEADSRNIPEFRDWYPLAVRAGESIKPFTQSDDKEINERLLALVIARGDTRYSHSQDLNKCEIFRAAISTNYAFKRFTDDALPVPLVVRF